MTSLPRWLRQHLAALRVLIVLTVVVGNAYPLAVTAIVPGSSFGPAVNPPEKRLG